jgi:23S rRNA A2030 N6-methylase RlmJ
MERQVSRNEAKQLAHSAKFSKVKLSCHYYRQAAEEALKTGELQQGITQLKKIKTLLAKASPLPNDLQKQLIDCQGQIDNTQQTINASREATSSKRLEAEFDKEEEQDQDWQKKQLYDQ